MKLYTYLFVLVVALALAAPTGLLARNGEDDPSDTPEVSESPDESDSPDASNSPKPSGTPDDDEDGDDDELKTNTPRPSSSVRPSGTAKPAGTPEREDDERDDNSGRGSDDGDGDKDEPRETPEILVPADLEDDAANIASDDDDVRKIEVDEDRVEVKYRLRARLFGVIDVPYELEARVETKDGERTVEARGPWWLLFARDNSDEAQSALEGEESLLTDKNQGTVLSTIIDILKSLAQ